MSDIVLASKRQNSVTDTRVNLNLIALIPMT